MFERPEIVNPFPTDADLARQIHFDGSIPEIILAAGPTRSVTTLWNRLMFEQGMTTFYQPAKAILRNLMYGLPIQLRIPDGLERIFSKETIGIFHLQETTFDPIEVFIAAGVPPEKIKLIIVLRDPLATAVSIMDKYEYILGRVEGLNTKDQLLEMFIASYRQVARIHANATRGGVKTASNIYEAYRDADPVGVAGTLLDKLEIPHHSEKIRRWKPMEKLTDFAVHLDEPKFLYTDSDFFGDVLKSTGIKYSDKTAQRIQDLLTPAQIERIYESAIYNIYFEHCRICERDTGADLLPFMVRGKTTGSLIRHEGYPLTLG